MSFPYAVARPWKSLRQQKLATILYFLFWPRQPILLLRLSEKLQAFGLHPSMSDAVHGFENS